jgi:hypothetical protein
MHRVILSPPDGLQVDHVDGNGLNNQRTNLRLCTHTENCRNSRLAKKRVHFQCRFKGVAFERSRKHCWKAHIRTPNGQKTLGRFDTQEAAACAYNAAARELFGDFANLNPV